MEDGRGSWGWGLPWRQGKTAQSCIAAAAKSLQSCPTLCDPIDGSPPAPPSLGFSRPEHWSGLPFPSPMHESEKWKWSRAVVYYSSRPHGLQPTRLLRPWDFPSKSTGVGCHCCITTGQSSPSRSSIELEESRVRMYYVQWESAIYWWPEVFACIQFSSVTQSCLTLWDPMDCSTTGFPVHHQPPKFT